MPAPDAKITGIVTSTASISDKIRALHAAGLSRSEIATKLNRRYQHVRNVLVNDQRRLSGQSVQGVSAAKQADAQADATAEGNVKGLLTLDVGSSGALSLPQLVLAAIGAASGDRVIVEFGPGEARIMTVATAAQRAQCLVASIVPQDRDLVGELIAERSAAGVEGE